MVWSITRLTETPCSHSISKSLGPDVLGAPGRKRGRDSMTFKRWCLIILMVAAGIFVGAQTADEFDRVVDFSISLKETVGLIEAGKTSQLDRNRVLLLNGTLVNVLPGGTFYLLAADDLVNPMGFFSMLKEQVSPLARLLWLALSDGSRQMIVDSTSGNPLDTGQASGILKELNSLLRNRLIYTAEVFEGVVLGKAIRSILQFDLEGEERTYLNRLLIEAAFPEDIHPVRVRGEIVGGEWIGTEEVKTYRGSVDFRGAPSFLVFERRRPSSASSLMIPLNSRVLVAVLPIDPIETIRGDSSWLFDVLYVRQIK